MCRPHVHWFHFLLRLHSICAQSCYYRSILFIHNNIILHFTTFNIALIGFSVTTICSSQAFLRFSISWFSMHFFSSNTSFWMQPRFYSSSRNFEFWNSFALYSSMMIFSINSFYPWSLFSSTIMFSTSSLSWSSRSLCSMSSQSASYFGSHCSRQAQLFFHPIGAILLRFHII